MTYHSLFTAFFTIGTLDVENDEVALSVVTDPNAFGCLLTAKRLVHDFEVSIEEQVHQCTLARTLTANHGHDFIISTALH